MHKPASYIQVGFATFQAQLIWTLWFLGIMLVINLVRLVISSFGINSEYFYGQLFISSNIFMLIAGIITIYFLRFFVENGVTRKNYFYGNVLAAMGISILIPVVGYVISLLENFMFANGKKVPDFQPEFDGNILGDLIQTIIVAPFVDPDTAPLLSLVVFGMNIFGFYLIGWMISSAFYRLNVISGLVFIALGFVFIAIKDTMMRIVLELPLFEIFPVFQSVPKSIALLLVVAVFLLILFIIRSLTKRAPIKI